MSLERHLPVPTHGVTVDVKAGQGFHEETGGRQQTRAEKQACTEGRWSPASEKKAEQEKC